jgi:hypothetical protein
MTKVITVAIILLVLWGGWEFFFYWERVKNQEETQKKEAIAARTIGEALPGMPLQGSQPLENSLRAAQNKGAAALGEWLKVYGSRVEDPRKAWIELDYCVALAATDPAEARRVFAAVKSRTPHDSPVWPRIKELEKTFE